METGIAKEGFDVPLDLPDALGADLALRLAQQAPVPELLPMKQLFGPRTRAVTFAGVEFDVPGLGVDIPERSLRVIGIDNLPFSG